MTFFKNFCTFKAFFTAFCTLAVILMISYWMYKYYNDEDLCLVDYKPIQELQEESLPVLSLCYYHPFIKDKQLNTTFNESHYVEHLRGNVHEENFKHTQTIKALEEENFHLSFEGPTDYKVWDYSNLNSKELTPISLCLGNYYNQAAIYTSMDELRKKWGV